MNPGLYGLSPGAAMPYWNGIYQTYVMTSSGDFVAPVDGYYLVSLVGAGGSGARNIDVTPGCGSAGGFSQKRVYLSKGQRLSATLAAGAVLGAASTALDGNAASVSTLVGPSINLRCEGGGRGLMAGGSDAGGMAYGGDVNVQGGTGTTQYGGSVPVYGIALAAGAEPAPLTAAVLGASSFLNGRILCPAGGVPSLTSGAQPGRRGAASGTDGGIGGIFAGGGAGVTTSTTSTSGGNGGVGAGGGGARRSSANSASMNPGDGGDSLVVIEWLQNMEA